MSARIFVIERCAYCRYGHPDRNFGYCNHPKFSGLDRAKSVDLDAPPPEWCPLTPAADVARVKPLVWSDKSDYVEQVSTAWNDAVLCTVRKMARGWNWRAEFCGSAGCWQPCESLEAGKAACAAHYRAALFGDNGPLEQIEVPK